jgi:hypothetical protein
VFFNTNPIRPGREQGGAALQEKDLLDVAAARLHGTAPSRRSILALMWPGIAIALRRGARATTASVPKATTRYDGESSDNGPKTRPDLWRCRRRAPLGGWVFGGGCTSEWRRGREPGGVFWWGSIWPWYPHGWGARRYGCRAGWEGSRGTFRCGGVGSSPHLSCVREESDFVCRHVIGAMEGMGKDLVDAFHVDELVSAFFV